MKIIALVENHSECGAKTVHGLSLYIQTVRHRLLFDLGPDETLFENARALGLDLTAVDTVILSHGHRDHGGALGRFLAVNHRAKVYARRKAFQPHFSRVGPIRKDIGLDPSLAAHPQMVLLEGDAVLDEELSLFTAPRRDLCPSPANASLYAGETRDDFSHEQSLFIREKQNVLVMGCGHAGLLNILDASPHPDAVVGGYHLFNPLSRRTVPKALLEAIARGLEPYADTSFFTCHCTGLPAYRLLAETVPHMAYLSCGMEIEC